MRPAVAEGFVKGLPPCSEFTILLQNVENLYTDSSPAHGKI